LRTTGVCLGHPLSPVVNRGTRTIDVSIIDPHHQIGVGRREVLGVCPVHRSSRQALVALDKPSILPDTVPMIRFSVAQHFWFFGYPTMLAAGGTRVI